MTVDVMYSRYNGDPQFKEIPVQLSKAAGGVRDFDFLVGTWRAQHRRAVTLRCFDASGKPIRIRFIWSRIAASSCQWEQAFSSDPGLNWETDWIMAFTRSER